MPDRMCVTCRGKFPSEALFRMVAGPDGEVVAELGSRLPGRGGHCCFRPECIRGALEAKKLEHVLRARVTPPGAEELTEHLSALLRERLGGLLSAGGRKGVLAAGRDAALRAARAGGEGRWFLARDLSAGSLGEVKKEAARAVSLPMRMEEIGDILGRRPVGVLYVADASLAESLAMRAAQASSLGAA